MPNSVNTNTGALVALASLRTINSDLDKTSKKVQTGFKVADASDDAAVFSVAQGIRGNIKAYSAVQSSLANGEGLGQVTNAALKGISDQIAEVRAKLALLGNDALTAEQRTIYQNDVNELLGTMTRYAQQAEYNGQNLIKTGGTDLSTVGDTSGTILTLTAVDIEAAITTAQGALAMTGSADYAADVTAIDTLENAVNDASATIAAQTKAMSLQKSFVDDLVDATKKGLGALVDADVAAESATLQSLQVRQQLAIQSLSIANQSPNTLLSLFR
jgi:flagellin